MKAIVVLFTTVFISAHVCAADRITVKAAKVSEVAIYPEHSAPASIISMNESIISAQIAARVDALLVRVGDIVEKGGVLAQLDCTDYVLSRRESLARLQVLETRQDLAKRRLERTRQLTIKQSVAEEILDERESDYAVLGAELRGIKTEIEIKKTDESRCTVLSPFRALVIERTSSVGEFVNVGTALVKIMDVDMTEISAQVSSRDTEQVSHAGELYFEHDGIRYPVKLRAIVQAINAETRNREVRLSFVGSHALPGATGKLFWRDERAHIPGELLVRRNGELGVFTIEGSVAKFNSMPAAQAGRASATSLSKDARVVTEGHYLLKESIPVEIVN